MNLDRKNGRQCDNSKIIKQITTRDPKKNDFENFKNLLKKCSEIYPSYINKNFYYKIYSKPNFVLKSPEFLESNIFDLGLDTFFKNFKNENLESENPSETFSEPTSHSNDIKKDYGDNINNTGSLDNSSINPKKGNKWQKDIESINYNNKSLPNPQIKKYSNEKNYLQSKQILKKLIEDKMQQNGIKEIEENALQILLRFDYSLIVKILEIAIKIFLEKENTFNRGETSLQTKNDIEKENIIKEIEKADLEDLSVYKKIKEINKNLNADKENSMKKTETKKTSMSEKNVEKIKKKRSFMEEVIKNESLDKLMGMDFDGNVISKSENDRGIKSVKRNLILNSKNIVGALEEMGKENKYIRNIAMDLITEGFV